MIEADDAASSADPRREASGRVVRISAKLARTRGPSLRRAREHLHEQTSAAAEEHRQRIERGRDQLDRARLVGGADAGQLRTGRRG